MIAKNYMQHPEALRFQHELFSNGYHNSPRIMRLMECIFDWTPTVPGWWAAAKAKARALAKAVKKSIADLFKETKVIQLKLEFVQGSITNKPEDWERLKEFSDWMDKTFNQALTTTPDLTAKLGHKNSAVGENWYMSCQGAYRLFCPTQRHALFRGGFQYAAAT
ncbi:hypothetical protein SAMN05216350_12116 [Polaromonas sp. YR568]|uniref:hypothetical protein n=1 Tax=Polaromonas sp. YR568 TaxID=1855301 RepID=UPI0008EE06B6|nr:hypothetical protein [Polaromonas sp. YR568]SFV04580.1 hypothetical protein SAMN05216350_12116 [Polaromonas sp. YR568]